MGLLIPFLWANKFRWDFFFSSIFFFFSKFYVLQMMAEGVRVRHELDAELITQQAVGWGCFRGGILLSLLQVLNTGQSSSSMARRGKKSRRRREGRRAGECGFRRNWRSVRVERKRAPQKRRMQSVSSPWSPLILLNFLWCTMCNLWKSEEAKGERSEETDPFWKIIKKLKKVGHFCGKVGWKKKNFYHIYISIYIYIYI